MSTLNLTHFKSRTTADYIEHCNEELDHLTRGVFSIEKEASPKVSFQKNLLIHLFHQGMKQLSIFLGKPKEQRSGFSFPASLRLPLKKIHETTLEALDQLVLTLKGEQNIEICHYPLPVMFISENNERTPLTIQDQQEIQDNLIRGLKHKVSTLLDEIQTKRRSLEKDASEAVAAKQERSKSESKRKLEKMRDIFSKASTREGAFALVQENPMHLKYVKALQDDYEIVHLAISKDPKSFQFASPRLKNHPTMIKSILQQANSDHLLEFISQQSMQDKERLLEMVRDNELALSYAVDDGYDLDFLLETILANPMCYQVLNESLRKNKEIFDLFMMLVLQNKDFEEVSILLVIPQEFHSLARAYFTIEQDHLQYFQLPAEIQKDPAIISYYFTQRISEECVNSLVGLESLDPNDENLEDFFEFIREVPSESRTFAKCLCEARLLNQFDITQLSDALKNNIHVILNAALSDHIRFESLPESFKSSSFYLKLLVSCNVDFYQQLTEEQRKIPSLAKIALSKKLSLFQHVPTPLRENVEFVLEILEADTYDYNDGMAPTFLNALPASIRQNAQIMLAAIELIPCFYDYLTEAEQENPAYALKAADAGIFDHFFRIPPRLRTHHPLLLNALEKTPSLINEYPSDLTKDEDFLYAALENNSSLFFIFKNFENLKDLDRLYLFLDRKLHEKKIDYIEHYLWGVDFSRILVYKTMHEELLIKILNENKALTKCLLESNTIAFDLKQPKTRFLKTLRTFFLNNPEKFQELATIPKDEMELPEELLIDLIGHDSRFFGMLHKTYMREPFIKTAIRANRNVYDRLMNSKAKAHPPFKAARAISLPYYRPLDKES